MQIIVEGTLIETRDIWSIFSIYGKNGKYDEVGFAIGIIDKKPIVFYTKCPERTDGNTKRDKQAIYDKLMNKVIELWKSDKTNMPILEL
jgi:hypothetical protein